MTTEANAERAAGPIAAALERRLDIIVAIALTVPALVIRRFHLPRDGIGGDDGWVVAGAKGELVDVFRAGLTHPGFTGFVKAWLEFVSDSPETTTLPLFAVSLVTPALAYLGLRRVGLGRPASLVAGAVMAVAPAHVSFSGRVKPYVIEAFVVLVIGLLLPRLARIDWSWRTVAVWVPATVIASTFSSFILVSSAVAMLLLTAWSGRDRAVRLTALVTQGALQLALFLATRTTHDPDAFATWWADPPSDGKVELYLNPIDQIQEVGDHFRHLGAAAVGGGAFPAVALVLISLVGLATWTRKHPQAPMAQFFGLLVVVAFIGGVSQKMPFGARLEAKGTRASIWLIPSLVVGLAMAVETVTGAVRRRSSSVPVLGLSVVAGVAVILAGMGQRPNEGDTNPARIGMRSANELVQELAGPDDVIVPNIFAWFSLAAEPGIDVEIRRDDSQLMGFFPFPATDRVWLAYRGTGWDGSVEHLEEVIDGAGRVVFLDFTASFDSGRVAPVIEALEALGYTEIESGRFEAIMVLAFEKASDPAA